MTKTRRKVNFNLSIWKFEIGGCGRSLLMKYTKLAQTIFAQLCCYLVLVTFVSILSRAFL